MECRKINKRSRINLNIPNFVLILIILSLLEIIFEAIKPTYTNPYLNYYVLKQNSVSLIDMSVLSNAKLESQAGNFI